MEESVSGFICYIATKRGVFTHKFILTYVPAVLFCLLYLFSILNWPISSNASFTFAHILCAWPKTTKLYSFLKVCFECGDDRILVDLFDIYFKVSLIFSTPMFLCIVQHLSYESLNMERILIYLLRKWNILNSSWGKCIFFYGKWNGCQCCVQSYVLMLRCLLANKIPNMNWTCYEFVSTTIIFRMCI